MQSKDEKFLFIFSIIFLFKNEKKIIIFNMYNRMSGNAGLNQYCYNLGYQHCSPSINPDPVGEGIEAFTCSLKDSSNKYYGQGCVDALKTKLNMSFSYSLSSSNFKK